MSDDDDGVSQVVVNQRNGGRLRLRTGAREGTVLLAAYMCEVEVTLELEPAEAGAVQLFLNSVRRGRDTADDVKAWVDGFFSCPECRAKGTHKLDCSRARGARG